MKKKKLVMYLLSAALVFSFYPATAAFAAVPEAPIEQQEVTRCVITFEAISLKKAKADISARTQRTASSIKSTVTLQSASLGTTNFRDVSGVNPETYTVYNTKNIHHTCNFPITSDKEYRIKVKITDKIDGTESCSTYYSVLE